MSSWVLAIDFGSSTTAAAYRNPSDGRIHDLPLSGGVPWMPSAVFKSGQQVLVGRAAIQAAMSKPNALEQSPQQRLADGRHMTLDGVDVAPTDVVSAVLSHVVSRALLAMNRQPEVVVLTYPTYWGPELRTRLARAAEAAGIDSSRLRLISEADAAIGFYTAHGRRLRVGTRVVIFDFGAARCNVVVLDKQPDRSFTTLVGDSIDGIAGDALDARLTNWVHRQLAANRPTTAELDITRLGADRLSLADRIRETKETLSQATSATIVVGRGAEVCTLSLTREDFDRVIHPVVDHVMAFVTDVVARANTRIRASGPPIIYLSGGSATVPLVGRRLARLGSVGRLGHPKSILCHGALEFPWPASSTPTHDEPTSVITVGGRKADISSAEPSTKEIRRPVAQPEPPPEKALPFNKDARFTVYRAPVIATDRWTPLLGFAHLGEPPVGPADLIRQTQAHTKADVGDRAETDTPVPEENSATTSDDTELSFTLTMPGIDVQSAARTFLWIKPVHMEEFRIRAPAALDGRTVHGKLLVHHGNILLAEVQLSMHIAAGTPVDVGSNQTPETAAPYQKIFASYSRGDTAIDAQFDRFVEALGDRYLSDVRTLRSDETWSERLEALIREADVFQLFWSHNAMSSSFVKQEWQYALSLQRPGFIHSTYWEEPIPSAPGLPPEELGKFHFHPLKTTTPVAAPKQASAPPRRITEEPTVTVTQREFLGALRPPPQPQSEPAAPTTVPTNPPSALHPAPGPPPSFSAPPPLGEYRTVQPDAQRVGRWRFVLLVISIIAVVAAAAMIAVVLLG